MKNFFSRTRSRVNELLGEREISQSEEAQKEYIELDSTGSDASKQMTVKTYTIGAFGDIKEVLDDLRHGHTVAILNIKPLREQDTVDLQRAISKLKKTGEAVNGDIAGLGEDYIIATPERVSITRTSKRSPPPEEVRKELSNELEEY
ncbi:MAG: cell division protein SepF [Candidatus Woesearchaeota archaeon]